MMSLFFSSKKLRRKTRYLFFFVILLVGVAVYHEMAAVNKMWITGNVFSGVNLESYSWKKAMFENSVIEDHQQDILEDSAALRSKFKPQIWKPEFKGKANLHVFEDWCGSSVSDLSRNIHYPLYPHSRTTVQKLAVSPQWTNYGLRIFGYLHPYTDGKFVFALSSDDNSEFWLSTDESPLNVRLVAWVGKSGTEFTAPGEFDKFASQLSRPFLLSAQTKYYFEVIHKQNDGGTDHVEVAWQLLDQDQKLTVIESEYISLYVNESGLLLGDVTHIPQTAATNQQPLKNEQSGKADMLRKDARDTLYRMPLLNSSFLHGVLPNCSYKPSYTIKGWILPRYQGLNYIHLSYVYPNDYTRLTHMENQESCFYLVNPNHKINDFSQYMKLDHPAKKKNGFHFPWKKLLSHEEDIRPDPMDNDPFLHYGDGFNNSAKKRRRNLFSLVKQETHRKEEEIPSDTRRSDASEASKHQLVIGSEKLMPKQKFHELLSLNDSKLPPELLSVTKQQKIETKFNRATPQRQNHLLRLIQRYADSSENISNEEIQGNLHLQQENNIYRVKRNAAENMDGEKSDMKGEQNLANEEPERKSDITKGQGKLVLEPEQIIAEMVEEDHSLPEVFDPEVNWSQTIQVSQLDLHAHRGDKIELGCSISGNLLSNSNDIQSVVMAFMDNLNQKHKEQLKLMRVINVVKRVDRVHGSRLLLELEVKDGDDKLYRLSHYVYHLTDLGELYKKKFYLSNPNPQPFLCTPVNFHWNPGVTVHVIVPVKNQARWVQQLINDMERVFKDTQDVNLNLIIADFSSTDMDVKKALQKSTLPRYQYIKLRGNFQRSAGLQAGVNIVKDAHSIVFLCDLHLHFPSSIIDTIRKHCVEGYMTFAPVVMRLDCGATPLDARGWWEVNGFGLLGIYKSDLEALGGMNTREYRAGWGGEDWELLDRILQAGLEVDRIYMRNFFHYYHSKRGMWNHGLSPKTR